MGDHLTHGVEQLPLVVLQFVKNRHRNFIPRRRLILMLSAGQLHLKINRIVFAGARESIIETGDIYLSCVCMVVLANQVDHVSSVINGGGTNHFCVELGEVVEVYSIDHAE